MLRIITLTISLLLVSLSTSRASDAIAGRVFDAGTREPLAFVHILINDTQQGGLTDIDGYFRLSYPDTIHKLRLSYVGYQSKVLEVGDDDQRLNIYLEKQPVTLTEVEVFPGENPAHRIIEKVIRHREDNDPEQLPSFSYTSYNKFIFTGHIDEGPADADPEQVNSVIVNIADYLEQRHFFLMETVTERKFLYPSRNDEEVLASRVSGVEHPMFPAFMSQMQSFSFYDDYIDIFDARYLSPLAPGSTERYFFMMEDTTRVAQDTVFVISYRPSRGRNFEGLKGVMYVNTNGWALQSVIAEPATADEASRVRIQQKYEQIEGRRWFPVELNTDFELLNVDGLQGLTIVGEGRTYLHGIELEPPLSGRDFSAFDMTFSEENTARDNQFWEDYRKDTLSLREQNTYHYLDSVGTEHDLDGQVDRLEALFAGKWRRGVIDVDLLKMVGYNRREGFRPGLAVQTNERLSPRFRLRGLLAYGFRDKTWKYGGGTEIRLHRLSDFWFGYDYLNDVTERGSSTFLTSPSLVSPDNIRSFFLRTVDMRESHSLWLRFRTFRNYLALRPYVSYRMVSYSDDYRYLPGGFSEKHEGESGQTGFRYFETGLQMRLAYGERFILTPNRIMRIGGDYPTLYINIARGMQGVLEGEYAYWRLEAQFRKKYTIPMLGTQQWTLRGGYFTGEAPWHRRFTASGAYRRFAISIPETFATMRVNEFVSDRYVSLFWYHNFGRLLYRGNSFEPQFLITTNVGIGTMEHPEHHHAGFATMENGYLESGIVILDLIGSGFSSMGLAFTVRYGPYAKPSFKDNYTIALSYSFMFR